MSRRAGDGDTFVLAKVSVVGSQIAAALTLALASVSTNLANLCKPHGRGFWPGGCGKYFGSVLMCERWLLVHLDAGMQPTKGELAGLIVNTGHF